MSAKTDFMIAWDGLWSNERDSARSRPANRVAWPVSEWLAETVDHPPALPAELPPLLHRRVIGLRAAGPPRRS